MTVFLHLFVFYVYWAHLNKITEKETRNSEAIDIFDSDLI